MENATAQGTLSVTQEIQENYELEFRNVTFTYPGNTVPSLSNISCKLKKGEKTAVVGPNGSGKSTFIKLLCRLYDPQEGQILLNGVDIREYNYDEYLKLFSIANFSKALTRAAYFSLEMLPRLSAMKRVSR